MLRFSPDGAKIAVGDAGREIKVWEIGKAEPVITRKWMAHQSTVTTICWAPEGDRLVSGSVDGRIVVWNMSKPREINERPQIHPGGVFCVDWADNNVVYTCGDDACVREVQLVMCSVCNTKTAFSHLGTKTAFSRLKQGAASHLWNKTQTVI